MRLGTWLLFFLTLTLCSHTHAHTLTPTHLPANAITPPLTITVRRSTCSCSLQPSHSSSPLSSINCLQHTHAHSLNMFHQYFLFIYFHFHAGSSFVFLPQILHSSSHSKQKWWPEQSCIILTASQSINFIFIFSWQHVIIVGRVNRVQLKWPLGSIKFTYWVRWFFKCLPGQTRKQEETVLWTEHWEGHTEAGRGALWHFGCTSSATFMFYCVDPTWNQFQFRWMDLQQTKRIWAQFWLSHTSWHCQEALWSLWDFFPPHVTLPSITAVLLRGRGWPQQEHAWQKLWDGGRKCRQMWNPGVRRVWVSLSRCRLCMCLVCVCDTLCVCITLWSLGLRIWSLTAEDLSLRVRSGLSLWSRFGFDCLREWKKEKQSVF